jgi:hypothetical protein
VKRTEGESDRNLLRVTRQQAEVCDSVSSAAGECSAGFFRMLS